MRGDRLRLAGALQQEELRQDGHALQPDAERPHDLRGCVRIRVDQCQHQRAAEQVLHAEGVQVGIVRRLVRCGHQVDGVAGAGEEEELEDGVVGAVGEGPEEIEVPRHVDEQIEGLRLEGDSRTALARDGQFWVEVWP
ncbi:hypothetical protein BP6252_00144 [Coleophoma cylindrospora]|uniref:Uncharacterized protein n=1 Tax=Coleophoma cylindrospora TaxID=1849047 RepID=A0A3D8SP91_9HELO|nr:hypothetical protein BP6252_00144 [Coleophoma cylindrospora]